MVNVRVDEHGIEVLLSSLPRPSAFGFLCPHSLVTTAKDRGMGTGEWLKRRGRPVGGSRFEMTPPGQAGRGEKQPL